MKKILFIAVLTCLISYGTNAQMLNNNLSEGYYTIDYVFTGKVNPGLDSLFALRYKFLKLYLNKFDKLIIEDNTRKMILDLNHVQSKDSVEIQSDGRYTYLIIKKYDKEGLPLVTLGIDKNGSTQDLLIRNADGRILSAGQFRQMERMNSDRFRQFKAGKR